MRDRQLILFGVLNLVQGALVGSIPLFVSSREPFVNWVLGAIAIIMLLAAPALVFGGQLGRVLATAACLMHAITGTVFAALVAFAASYLLGIYGRHGLAMGSLSFVIAVFLLVVFWLIPAHELHFLRKRAGEQQ